MPVLEIITIGTELLLGEIADTNSTYIARTLRDHGIDIFRITTIGDNPGRITAAIKEALNRADIVITTGGLGPTVDDPTRQAVADAVGRPLQFKDELWEQIVTRFKAYGRTPTENNRRQAYIPDGAIPIPNPVGTAPCFIVELDSAFVVSLPGVPREMEYILHHEIIPFLKNKFKLESQTIKATVLHTASMGESMVDEMIADLEANSNPTVGLLAHPGQVDIRVTAKASSEEQANQLIKPVVDELMSRLGENIYGQNGVTQVEAIASLLERLDLKCSIIEYGFNETFGKSLFTVNPNRVYLDNLSSPPSDDEELVKIIRSHRLAHPFGIGVGLALLEGTEIVLYLAYQNGKRTVFETRRYGGPRENALLWAQNNGMDFLRRNLNQLASDKETGEI